MHAGVERDEERQRIKRERQADFEMQRRLEEEYRKIQNVPDGQNDPSATLFEKGGYYSKLPSSSRSGDGGLCVYHMA